MVCSSKSESAQTKNIMETANPMYCYQYMSVADPGGVDWVASHPPLGLQSP